MCVHVHVCEGFCPYVSTQNNSHMFQMPVGFSVFPTLNLPLFEPFSCLSLLDPNAVFKNYVLVSRYSKIICSCL
jgi:hypothetical protein